MNLEQVLRNALNNIRSDKLTNEAQVKQAVILPILGELGWNYSNPIEFVPEYAVGTEDGRGSVDYALCSTLPAQGPLIFIETKKLGSVDVAGEIQLFRYASNRGVPFLVLTDGNVWNFYLSMAPGTPVERLVYRAELTQEERLTEYAGFFERYLEKERVLSGKAKQDAEQDKQSAVHRLTAQNTIPSSWQGLLSEPDDSLVELLVVAVEKSCGIRPESEDVRSFLRDQRSITTTRQGIIPKPLIPSAPVESKSISGPDASKKRSKIVGFILDGSPQNCGSGVRTIEQILIAFHKRDYTFMERFAPRTIGRNRRLVAQDPDDLYDNPSLRGESRDLGNGWWLATNISTETIRLYVKVACEVAGVKFGSQLTLIER